MSDEHLLRMIDRQQALAERVERLERLELPPFRVGARVYNSANISVPTSTLTYLTFDSTEWDTHGFYDAGATDRLTCQVAGYYLVIGQLQWQNINGGRRLHIMRANGTDSIAMFEYNQLTSSGLYPRMVLPTIWKFAVGDYVQLRVQHSQGGNINVENSGRWSPALMMYRLA